MKKIIYYIAISVMCLLPFSCSLEEETRTEVEKKNYMNNADEAKDVLLGVYRTTIVDAMYGYHLSILFNLGTDISQVEGSGNENFRIIPTNSFPTTQSEVQQTWAALYTGIYRANDFLERISNKIESYTNTDKKLATIYIAEARVQKCLIKIRQHMYNQPQKKSMSTLKMICYMHLIYYHMQSMTNIVKVMNTVFQKELH